MTAHTLLAFNLALLAALISPGPALLVAIRTTLSAGRAAGVAMGCGLASMASLWTLMALLGLESVFRWFPWAYSLAKIAGAGYLIYLAIGMWLRARDGVSERALPSRHAFRDGFLLNLLNPKSVLFAAAVLIVVFPAGMSTGENVAVVLNHLFIEVLFYSLLAFGMSTATVKARYLRAKLYLDRTSSVILGALGLRLLTQR